MKRLLKFLLYTLCSGVLLLYMPVITAQNSDDMEMSAVVDLVGRLKQSSVLSADIEQLTLDQDGRELQEIGAKLVFQKPDHLYWEIISPYSELTLINGEKIWIFEPDLDQVTIQDFDNDLNLTPLLLLSGDAESIQRNYIVTTNELVEGKHTHFVLMPRDPGNLVESLSLTFAENILTEMHFEDSLGQKTSLLFSNVLSGFDIDEDIFEFTIPDGIEVIDNSDQ